MSGAVDNTPVNKNFLSPLNFAFVLKRSPHLNFFVQQVTLPRMSLPEFFQPTPLLRVPQTGDHIDYGNLAVTFKVDEEMKNYLEVHNWIKGIGYPETPEQYRALYNKKSATGESIKSDISIIAYDGLKNPNFEMTFKDAFPIELEGMSLQTTDTTVDYVTATATFKFTIFEITRL